jgi:hypothetical protein
MANAAQSAPATPQQPAKSNFQMTIIYPTEVSKVEFSANGDPILPQNSPAVALPTPAAGAAAGAVKALPPAAPDLPAATPPDFPINLRLK